MGSPLASIRPRSPGVQRIEDKCVLHEPGAIRSLLQRLTDARGLLTVRPGAAAAGTALVALAIDGDILWLAEPRGRGLLRLLGAGRLSLEGHLAGVVLRFGAGAPAPGRRSGATALGIPLPLRLLCVQWRREHHREPRTTALPCTIHLPDGSAGTAALRTTIRDIGGGGLALVTSAAPLPFACGDLLPNCTIELPGAKPLDVAMRVRHVRRLRQRGLDLHQFGCEFIGLSAAALATLSAI